MIGLGIWLSRGGGGSGLVGPNAPSFTASEGGEPGEIDWTDIVLPTDWGDATERGDGLGTLGILEWWNEADGWQTFADPADTDPVTTDTNETLWDTEITIGLRGVNDEGVAGTAVYALFTPAGVVIFTVIDGPGNPVTDDAGASSVIDSN
jgi:hypothetical protein